MPVQVRTIEPAELTAWVKATHVPFLIDRSAEDEAAFRHPLTDFDRTWGAFAEDGRIVGTLRSFGTPLTVPGGAPLPADAVTAVSVAPTHRRQGILTAMMDADLRAAAERGESASILIASEYPIYGRFGYGPATEHATWLVDTRAARFLHTSDGSLELLEPAALRQQAPPLYERFRATQPGAITRRDIRWDVDLGLIEAPWHPRWKGWTVLYRDPAGQPQGYLRYHVENVWEERLPKSILLVDELLALTPAAYARLWRYCCEVDLVTTVKASDRRVDEPLPWLLADARAARQTHRADLLWLRVLDPAAALACRAYSHAGQLVLEVTDPAGYANGRFRLEAGPDGATCYPTDEAPDLTLPVQALGAAYLGGPSLRTLANANWLDEHRPGAVALADSLFRSPITPWCNTWF